MTGQQLVERWAAWVRQFVFLTPEQSVVLVLWAMHTWVYDKFSATPYLSITGSTMRSGKTTCMKVIALLSRGAEIEATIRVISMARKIAAMEGKLTIFLDEAEKLSHAALGETRTILATGYNSGAQHSVTIGGEVQRFPTYCPKAFASIGDVQPVLRDRSIVIDLLRGTPQRSFTLERLQAENEASELVGALVEWFKTASLKRIPIVDPDWLTSARDREIWSPLFSIAAALGVGKGMTDQLIAFSVDNGEFKKLPPRVHYSVQDETDAEERTMSERALHDLLSVFQPGETRIASTDAVTRMRDIKTAPWRSWRGAGLNEIGLAALLSRYGVKPATMQFGKGRKERKVLNGYSHADLTRATKRD